MDISGVEDMFGNPIAPVTVAVPALLINATAADALFVSPFNFSGALAKDGVRKLTLAGGANLGSPVAVNNGTLAINGVFNGAGATV